MQDSLQFTSPRCWSFSKQIIQPGNIWSKILASINLVFRLHLSYGVKNASSNNLQNNIDFAAEVSFNKEDFTPLPQSSTSVEMTSSPMVRNCVCENCKKLGEKPPPIPGKVWTPVWVPLEIATPKENQSFQEVALDKMKGPKKDKIHLKTKIISDEKLLEEL